MGRASPSLSKSQVRILGAENVVELNLVISFIPDLFHLSPRAKEKDISVKNFNFPDQHCSLEALFSLICQLQHLSHVFPEKGPCLLPTIFATT